MIFILIGPDDTLQPLVQTIFGPENHIKVGPGQWILSADGSPTSKDVWARLVAGQEPAPSGMVFTVANGYFGLAPTHVWEWITTKRQLAASL